MRLTVLVPTEVVVDREVDAVVAESLHGSFGLLPHHVDVVAPLAASLLAYRVDDEETFMAVDGGTLVKCADEVLVSTPRAVCGPGLDDLRTTVTRTFQDIEARERDARAALVRLESDLLRRFVEVDHDAG